MKRGNDDAVSEWCSSHRPVATRFSATWGRLDLSTRDIVHWECRAPKHRALHSRHGNGGLTIHEATWAYCDGADADDAHQWSPTGGVALESLVRWTAPNGVLANGDALLVGATSREPKGLRKTSGVRRT